MEIKYKQAVNIIKNFTGYALSSILGKDVYFGKPVAASIEPANFCNLHCPHCPTGMSMLDKQAKLLDFERFKSIVDALLPELSYLNLYFQGEPFLNKQLPEMVAYASANKVFTCVSTNGHFFSEEIAVKLKKAGLGKLIVSLDGANAESYSKYRVGGDFGKVVECLRTAAKAGLPVELQCLLLESTENEIDEVKALAKSCGVKKTVFKTAQLYSDALMPHNNKLSRYKRDSSGTLVMKKRLKNRCLRLWSGVVVDVDGRVLPCCFDKEGKYAYGNIFQSDINEILHGPAAVNFRSAVLKRRKDIDICQNCTS